MATPLIIIARIQAKKDSAELVKEHLMRLIAPSRNDKGCLQYDLHQDNDDPSRFLFYEKWESRDLWQEHMKTPHLKAHAEATEGLIEDSDLQEMSLV
ncbi:MAG: antibiotic biosynthesis monooxygenase [Desulfovibrionales bacterium]|nr:antibiotic biosynthesis monooxygenase [Desulfovibrionales bacterium]